MTTLPRLTVWSLVTLAVVAPVAGGPQSVDDPAATLSRLTGDALGIRTTTRSTAEYAEAARRYDTILKQLSALDVKSLGRDDQIDADLLEAHVKTKFWEITAVKLHQVNPSSYLRLDQTSMLFLRPEVISDNDTLLTYGDLPFKQIRRLMF